MIGVVQTRGCLCPAGWGLCGLGYTMASAGALPSDLRKIVLWSFWGLVLFWFAHPSSEMTIYILERSVLGGTRPLLAADVYAFLQNVSRKVQTITLSICLESSSLNRYSPWKPPSRLLLLIEGHCDLFSPWQQLFIITSYRNVCILSGTPFSRNGLLYVVCWRGTWEYQADSEIMCRTTLRVFLCVWMWCLRESSSSHPVPKYVQLG